MTFLCIILLLLLYLIFRWILAMVTKHNIYPMVDKLGFRKFQFGIRLIRAVNDDDKRNYQESWAFYLGPIVLAINIIPEGKKIGNNYELIDDKEEKKDVQ